MSDLASDLAAMRVRCAAATQGPWMSDPEVPHRDCQQAKDGSCICCLALMGNVDKRDLDQWDEATLARWRADTSFIAHAREDLPLLLARLEEMQKALEFMIEKAGHIRVHDDLESAGLKDVALIANIFRPLDAPG